MSYQRAVEVQFRGLDVEVIYEDDEGQLDWWFADPVLNVSVVPTLLEEQRIIDACERDQNP